MIEQRELQSDGPYKAAFVEFIKSKQWHWFITIPIGLCDDDDEVLHRVRSIEATFCGKYLVNRYHKLPDEARYSMAVAFEGEAKCGSRHAHILAYVPLPTKMGKLVSHSMMIRLFPWEFRFLWNKFSPVMKRAQIERPFEQIHFGAANTARHIYTVKDVRQAEISWSRFEFVTPPKWSKFNNENLSVIRQELNKEKQRGSKPYDTKATFETIQTVFARVFSGHSTRASIGERIKGSDWGGPNDTDITDAPSAIIGRELVIHKAIDQ